MEYYVSLDFESSTIGIGVLYPNEVALCIICIAEKTASLPTWLKLRVMVCYNACSALDSEGL